MSLLASLPNTQAFEIVTVSNSNKSKGYWTKTDFGRTNALEIYLFLSTLWEGVIPLAMLVCFNMKSLALFNQIVEKSGGADNQDDLEMESFREDYINQSSLEMRKRFTDVNNRFTKMVISLTFICILTRSSDVVAGIFFFTRFCFPDIFGEYYSLEQFILALGMFTLIGAHALDGLLYYYYDRHMNKLLLNFHEAAQIIAISFIFGLIFVIIFLLRNENTITPIKIDSVFIL